MQVSTGVRFERKGDAMTDIVCVTNDRSMVDVRSCTVKGQHTDFCDGWEYRWVEEWNPETHKDVRVAILTGRECPGCLPRRAEHGFVCWHCFEKIEDALTLALDMITHLGSIDRAQQVDTQGIRGSSTWVLPVPATWRTADELLMLLGSNEPFPSTANVWEIEAITERFVYKHPDTWVNSKAGAEDAVRFYRLMQTAMAAHPMKEYEHRIRNTKCHKCGHWSLLWKPPLEHADDIHIVCTNPECGAVVDQAGYELLKSLDGSKEKAR